MGTTHSVHFSPAPGLALQRRPLGNEVKDAEQQPKEMAEFQQALKPRGQRIFFGTLYHQDLSFTERMIVKAIRAPEGDFRDWQDIEDWATSIVRDLR